MCPLGWTTFPIILLPACFRLGWAPGEILKRGGLEGGSEAAAILQLTCTETYLTSPSCVSGLRPFLDPPSAFPTPSPGVRVWLYDKEPRLLQVSLSAGPEQQALTRFQPVLTGSSSCLWVSAYPWALRFIANFLSQLHLITFKSQRQVWRKQP